MRISVWNCRASCTNRPAGYLQELCLGREKAEFLLGGNRTNGIVGRKMCSFPHTDLDAVKEAVRGCCVQAGLGFSVAKSPMDTIYEVRVSEGEDLTEEVHGPNPCHALLAACVEAAVSVL